MAEQDSTRPQAVDPEVQADLVRLLRIRGPLGVLNVADIIVPTVSLGNVVTPNINIRDPVFRSTDVFSAGTQIAPAAGVILADTLSLPAGTYDVIVKTAVAETAPRTVNLEHRDAANTANLMFIQVDSGPDIGFNGMEGFVFSYVLSVNERLRLLVVSAGSVGSRYTGVIFARLR